MPEPLHQYFLEEMRKAADPQKARQMAAYMKTGQKFYGVQAGPRRQIMRAGLKKYPIESRVQWNACILQLWRGETREEMYLALDVCQKYPQYHDAEAWPLFEVLVRTATNWDTLDWIASHFVGTVVAKNRDFEKQLIIWRVDTSFWVRRASLLAHLKHKEKTNSELLQETILCLAHEQEFFIRKAIGWVLREYGKTNPQWVQDFVSQNKDKLSGLSIREAMKNLSK